MIRDELEVAANRPASLRGYDAKAWSVFLRKDTGRETLVQQQFATEVDINTIVRRFGITAQLPLGTGSGVYGDFTNISDFESAVERVEGARAAFMKLPPEVRERFGNDPGQLISMATTMDEGEFLSFFRAEPVIDAPVDP